MSTTEVARARVMHWLLAGMLVSMAAGAWGLESPTLTKIQETGVISLGYRDGSIPFSYLDEKQHPIGYSMDLCLHIVNAVKHRLQLDDLQIRWTPVNSSTRIPMVANSTIDLECGTTTNTVVRQKYVSFAVTTFVAGSRLASKRSSHIRGLEDLRGRAVVSTAGTTSIARLVEMNAAMNLGMTILVGKDHVQSFRMVESDRAVAFAMDDVLLHGLIASARDPSIYTVSGEPLSVEPYGIALRKGDPEFKALADETIVSLFRSGEIHAIYRKWFESPIPPRPITLGLPMSESLKNVIARPTDSGNAADYR
jgi:glutamate/aspartate transport system substrate-binding protein